MEPGKAPREGRKLDTVVAGLWFHQLRAGSRSGGQWAVHEVTVEHMWDPELGRTGATQNLACQPQGLGPNSQQDCQGGLVQTLPTTSTHSWGCGSQETHHPGA